MNLLPQDSRIKWCDSPGCPERAVQGLTVVYAEQRIFDYCSDECGRSHRKLLLRNLPELRPTA